jgi:hypothetical protein
MICGMFVIWGTSAPFLLSGIGESVNRGILALIVGRNYSVTM